MLIVVKKANSALGAIFSLCKNVGALPVESSLKLFDALVVSTMSYAVEVWYSSLAMSKLEKIHTTFLRYVLGVRQSTPLLALYGKCGDGFHYTISK